MILQKIIILCTLLYLHCARAIERKYYISIEEERWDYAPSGKDLLTNQLLVNNSDAKVFYETGPNRIGGRYWKAIYKQYEDEDFAKETPKDPTLGFLGPTILGEVGDIITIYGRNLATRNYSLHPHGVQYEKNSEGAVYLDSTSIYDKIIQPGASKTTTWDMRAEYGPTEDDPDCVTWIYHSHVDSVADTYSGLVGGMLVCRPGTLDSNGQRTDVDRYFLLNFFVFDENLSWYIEKNVQEFCTDPSSVDYADPDFQESNTMHSINGRGYGNLQGLTACYGERVAWNMFGLGNEVDLHSAQFERQTIISEGHRADTVNLFPATFSAVEMQTDNPGSSIIACRVNDHYSAGMLTTLSVEENCAVKDITASSVITKHFFIGIQEIDWNYGPSGQNILTGKSLTTDGTDSQTFFQQGPNRIGGTYKKAVFEEYTDSNFDTPVQKNATFGIMGPLIAVEVGDVIEVVLHNFATNQNYNIEPHGLIYNDSTGVGPNETRSYIWTAPDSASPTDLDPDCITYLYTSSLDPVKDTNTGLMGPLMLCKRGTLSTAMSRAAYYLLFTVMDENQSHYLEENIQNFTTNPESVDTEDGDFQESNLMHSINGLMYGNLQNIDICQYGATDFHVIGLGTEVDMHSMFVTGANIEIRKEKTAVLSVFPHTTSSVTITPEQMGSGEIKCVVSDHLLGGMVTAYQVTNCGLTPISTPATGRTLTYYIAAVEENWDYTIQSTDTLGKSLSDPETPGYVYTHQSNGSRIGSTYKKAIYYEFTDDTFKTRKQKPANLGVLGPVIRAEEGDIINIVFKNMAASFSYSIAPWGAKDVSDSFNAKTTPVSPGVTHTYKWNVPSSAVPRENQPGCQAWFYMSNVDEIKDPYSGLMGPLLLCRKGALGSNGKTIDINQEFFLLFFIFDENSSNYLDENIQNYMGVDDPSNFDIENEDFMESNLLHSINGHIYQVPELYTNVNDEVIWHLLGWGNEVDIHTVHFHAHAYRHISDITTPGDVFKLFPGKIGTVQMKTTEPGTWLLHCHVDDHLSAGMITTYTVQEQQESSSLEGWAIALICIGSVLVVVVVGVLLWCLFCKSAKTTNVAV